MSKTSQDQRVITTASGFELAASEVLDDYRISLRSRLASLTGRKQVHSGRAAFGIFGDGKEVAQVAMAKAFKNGDFRAGYYRDQTLMFATGMSDLKQYFAQLYGETDVDIEPASGGRQMNSHFATRLLDEKGNWRSQVDTKNSSSDISPTGGQMARMLGLAYASKLYRKEPALIAAGPNEFSINGDEVTFGTIGNASTSEGIFFEVVNAAGVLQVPLALSIWDDGYGISVPNEYQTIKSSISKALEGFRKGDDAGSGIDFYVVRGWDYPSLVDAYLTGVDKVRREHVPALFHITEMTQPQGHSSDGSQERYKSKERLDWERDFDCIPKMRAWIIDEGIASTDVLDAIEEEERVYVEEQRKLAWEEYLKPLRDEQTQVVSLLKECAKDAAGSADEVNSIAEDLAGNTTPARRLTQSALVRANIAIRSHQGTASSKLRTLLAEYRAENEERYNSHLFSSSASSPIKVAAKAPTYSDSSTLVDGRIVLQHCFDHHLKKNANLFIVGEDVGKLGDVNLVFEGLNEKYGELRVTDTGIREASILGQGIGAALRGLRPIVDIQYLDYLLYALQVCSDDLATLHYRTSGGQKAPVIIRTKGHRLQGIWHTGSPMSVVLNALRGLYVAVPRNMTQAAGFYNTFLKGDNPAIVVEVLSGYRIKERIPDNVGTFTVSLGMPEVLRHGSDVTVVTYGACCKIALDAADALAQLGIESEIIDIQTLSPFDIYHSIVTSLAKTNAALFLDEDVPGGASAFMMQQVLEQQGGWSHLDTAPRSLTASPNRSPYGPDGGYFSKPNVEDVIEAVYSIMSERRPNDFPAIH